jgi:hypothetical protein
VVQERANSLERACVFQAMDLSFEERRAEQEQEAQIRRDGADPRDDGSTPERHTGTEFDEGRNGEWCREAAAREHSHEEEREVAMIVEQWVERREEACGIAPIGDDRAAQQSEEARVLVHHTILPLAGSFAKGRVRWARHGMTLEAEGEAGVVVPTSALRTGEGCIRDAGAARLAALPVEGGRRCIGRGFGGGGHRRDAGCAAGEDDEAEEHEVTHDTMVNLALRAIKWPGELAGRGAGTAGPRCGGRQSGAGSS